VLLILQRHAHSRNRPTATDEKKKVFSITVVISLVGIDREYSDFFYEFEEIFTFMNFTEF